MTREGEPEDATAAAERPTEVEGGAADPSAFVATLAWGSGGAGAEPADARATAWGHGTHGGGLPARVDPSARPLGEGDGGERYRAGERLGMGGMGEVLATSDLRIGREVALKRMRYPDDAALAARFVREARIQAQLEHPAIVPIYDLGLLPGGAPFFTMQRLRGQTLATRLHAEASGGAPPTGTRHELLTEFADLCLAIEYAHMRGVLHRDLKPDNLMLGDFGEAYVLDWGIAKASGAADEPTALTPDDLGRTSSGAVLGTPGYLAPEVLDGVELDARADVYALGCILFEILALEPLHRGATVDALLVSTMEGADARPSVRAPGRAIPPELDAICVAATALDRGARLGSARALHDALTAYLEGDRDLARRRALAEQHAARASALAAAPGLAARRDAMREAGRALALDPDSRGAIQLIGRLVVEPPSEIPLEVERAERLAIEASAAQGARHAMARNAVALVLVALAVLVGLRDPWFVTGITSTIVGGVALAYARGRAGRHLERVMWLSVLWQAAFVVLVGRVFGPLVVVPGLASAAMVGLIYYGVLRRPWLAVGVQAAAIVVPFALESIGALPASYRVVDGELIVRSSVFPYGEGVIGLLLVVALLVMGSLAGLVIDLRRGHMRGERLAALQAWHFRQLIPDDPAAPPPPTP